ncbi:hypothetical protein ACWWD0_18435, partial [Pseudomonas aeruginosa]
KTRKRGEPKKKPKTKPQPNTRHHRPPTHQRTSKPSITPDPLVRQLREQFAAVVRDGTIEPLEAKA